MDGHLLHILPQQGVDVVETNEQDDADDRGHYGCPVHHLFDEDRLKEPNHSLRKNKINTCTCMIIIILWAAKPTVITVINH